MAAFPARDQRRAQGEGRNEAPARDETSPQLQRALQVANAARARATRIRAESQAKYGTLGGTTTSSLEPRGVATATPRRAPPTGRSDTLSADSTPPAPARTAPDVAPEPPQVTPATPSVTIPKGTEETSSDPAASPDATAATPGEPPASSDTERLETGATPSGPPPEPPAVEPAAPSACAPEDNVPPADPDAGAPAPPRFARTRAAIEASRLSGWAIELNQAAPGESSQARPRFGGPIGADAQAAPDPAHAAATQPPLPDALGRIAPGQKRRAASAKPQAPHQELPSARSAPRIFHQRPPGASTTTADHPRAPQAGAAAASYDTAPGAAAPDGGRTAPARTGARAAYRSVRNSVAMVLVVVVSAGLLVGLRGEGTLEVVRSVWSMKPPRTMTVERVLTLDLPPFREVVEVPPLPQLKVAAPPAARAAETTPASATGGGEGGPALDLVAGAAADDPRITDLAAIVERDPSRWDAYYKLGHVMQSRGDLEAAERLYRQALSLNPRHAAMAYDLGYILQRRGDLQGAEEQYRAALALKPDHAYALYNLGALLRRQGAHAEAAELFERAGRVQSDNPDLYYEWARTLEARGRADQAIDLYRQAAALSPDRWPGPEARARMQTLLSEGPQTAEPRS